MSIELFRIDDRLIHGQVVVGWGQPLGLGFIVLVDDEVASSEWEQELYRMGVPAEMDVYFASVDDAARCMQTWVSDQRPGIVLTADIGTMARLVAALPQIKRINLGGIHYKAGRMERLRYIYLSDEEIEALRRLAGSGVHITAQDVPAARPLTLEDLVSHGGGG